MLKVKEEFFWEIEKYKEYEKSMDNLLFKIIDLKQHEPESPELKLLRQRFKDKKRLVDKERTKIIPEIKKIFKGKIEDLKIKDLKEEIGSCIQSVFRLLRSTVAR